MESDNIYRQFNFAFQDRFRSAVLFNTILVLIVRHYKVGLVLLRHEDFDGINQLFKAINLAYSEAGCSEWIWEVVVILSLAIVLHALQVLAKIIGAMVSLGYSVFKEAIEPRDRDSPVRRENRNLKRRLEDIERDLTELRYQEKETATEVGELQAKLDNSIRLTQKYKVSESEAKGDLKEQKKVNSDLVGRLESMKAVIDHSQSLAGLIFGFLTYRNLASNVMSLLQYYVKTETMLDVTAGNNLNWSTPNPVLQIAFELKLIQPKPEFSSEYGENWSLDVSMSILLSETEITNVGREFLAYAEEIQE